MQFAGNLGVRGLRVQKSGSAAETWPAIARELLSRRAHHERKTRETDISIDVDLDAEGPIHIDSGHGFFNHMLEQLAKHGGCAFHDLPRDVLELQRLEDAAHVGVYPLGERRDLPGEALGLLRGADERLDRPLRRSHALLGLGHHPVRLLRGLALQVGALRAQALEEARDLTGEILRAVVEGPELARDDLEAPALVPEVRGLDGQVEGDEAGALRDVLDASEELDAVVHRLVDLAEGLGARLVACGDLRHREPLGDDGLPGTLGRGEEARALLS